MSAPQQDSYLDELEEAEQDLKDKNEVYENAKNDLIEAIKWEDKTKKDMWEADKRVRLLKDKQAPYQNG